MKVFLAGRVAVEADGVLLDEARFPGRQGRLLFAYLVAQQGRPVPRDELAEAVWGEAPPATWDKALSVIVSKLRKLLADSGVDGGNLLTAAFGCYRLNLPEASWVDVVEAERAAQEAEDALAAGDVDKARAAAALAESLMRQPFLPGEDGAWVEAKRRELADVRGRALSSLADACLRSGEASEAVKWAEQAVALEPFRETGYRRLMEAHAAAGNRAEALHVYDRCRRLLADELGTYPSPETESIYRRLLEAPSPPVAAAIEAEARTVPARRRRRRLVLASAAVLVVLVLTSVAIRAVRNGSSELVAIMPDSVAVVDPSRNAVVADVALDTRPSTVAYGAGSLWVGTKDDRTLLQIDPHTHQVTRTIGLAAEPTSIATNEGDVWVLCAHANTLLQFHASTGTLVRKLPLDGTIRVGRFKGRPLRLAQVGSLPFDFYLAAGGGGAWIGYGNDVVARIDAETGVVEQLAAGSSFGIAFGGRAAWSIGGPLDGEPNGTLFRIDAQTREVTELPSAGTVMFGIAAGPNGIWAINTNHKRAWRIAPDIARVDAIVPLDHPPKAVAVGAGAVWIANDDGTLSRIDSRTAAVVRTITLGRYPRNAYPVDLAVGEGLVWVALH